MAVGMVPPPGAPKTVFSPSLCESILHRFSHFCTDSSKRFRSPTGSTLRRSWCAKSSLSLRFYSVFQRGARRPFWGPREAADRFVVDLVPFMESKRGPTTVPWRIEIEEQSLRRVFCFLIWPPVQSYITIFNPSKRLLLGHQRLFKRR